MSDQSIVFHFPKATFQSGGVIRPDGPEVTNSWLTSDATYLDRAMRFSRQDVWGHCLGNQRNRPYVFWMKLTDVEKWSKQCVFDENPEMTKIVIDIVIKNDRDWFSFGVKKLKDHMKFAQPELFTRLRKSLSVHHPWKR